MNRLLTVICIILLSASACANEDVQSHFCGYQAFGGEGFKMLSRPFVGCFDFITLPAPLRVAEVVFTLEAVHHSETDWQVVPLLFPEEPFVQIVGDTSFVWKAPISPGDTTSGTLSDYIFADAEDGTWGKDGVIDESIGSVNCHGPEVIGAMTGLLYDITDAYDDDPGCWDTVSNQFFPPDGRGDVLSFDPGTMLERAIQYNVQEMEQLYTAWKDFPSLGYLTELEDIYFEHGAEELTKGPVSVDELDSRELPDDFALSQNYPNPFNPQTVLEFSIPSRSHVRMEIFNILGQNVRTLVDETVAAGYYRVTWDGTDNSSQAVASGVYCCRMVSDDVKLTRKMLLLK